MRAMRYVLVLVVVVGVLLVVADRVGVWLAQRAVANQAADELANYQVDSAPPEVSIGGFPFLTQVGAERYEEVTLVLRDVGSGGVRLSNVELVASGVTVELSTIIDRDGPIDAERMDGTATIGYGDVAALTGLEGLQLSSGEGGELAVRLPTELLGEPATLVGSAELTAEGGAVQLRVAELTVADSAELPPGAESAIAEVTQQLTLDVPLPPLPYDLSVDSVRAGSAGLAVSVSATDVPLAR